MTWIKTVPLSEADETLRQALHEQRTLYPPEYAQQVPGLPDKDDDGIVAAHSLIPEALKHAFATFAACMAPDLPLKRRHHEMIATVVSATNRTAYCSASHSEFLRRVTLDDELVQALAADYRTASINTQEEAMLEYAIQVTRDATKITKSHHEHLRQTGFNDTAILQSP
jgi:uncharacterized peroxidase-related enzyme